MLALLLKLGLIKGTGGGITPAPPPSSAEVRITKTADVRVLKNGDRRVLK